MCVGGYELRRLIFGKAHGVVPYDENGALLEKYYKQCGLPNNACLDDIIVEILIWRVIGE